MVVKECRCRLSEVREAACAGDKAEMVMIGEDRPGLQLPLVLFRQLEKPVAEVLEALGAGESGLLEVCASGDDVGSGLRQAVNRAVRPIAHKTLRNF